MQLKFLTGAALIAALGVVMVPSSGFSAAVIHEHEADGAAEFDSRVGKIAPTKLQRAQAKRLKASVSWSRFGTPASLSRHGKALARGIRARTAADAARWYLNRNKALFGLGSIDQLELMSANKLAGSNGYAVNFRQVFGGLQAAEGGLVTVGVTGTVRRGWKVAHVSSALTRDRTLAGGVKLSAAQAWVTAAKDVGLERSIVDVLTRKQARGWTQLGVSGLQAQQTKLVAFPTIRSGVIPAYESIVLDVDKTLAQRVFVDARNGRVLARASLVDHAASGLKLMATTHTFNGEVPATDGACGPDHTFSIPAGNRALEGFAAATVITNDVVLFLFKDGVQLVAADTLFSPEQFRYEPPGGVPAGDYVVRVCDFNNPGAGAVWADPRTYTGTLTEDDSPTPPAYLARWGTFPANPPLHTLPADPWNNPSTDTRETWCWVSAPGCDRVVGNLASRGPWDHDHKLNTSTFTTRGNNARSATSWTQPFQPSPPQFMPTSATRDYSFPWSNAWFNEDCEPTPGTPGATWDDSAATANLFVAHNRMHDWAYFLGFTEQNWNGQDYNFGLTEKFRENDPLIGNVQAGAISGPPPQRDNANMITLPEGTPSVTNMYFWQALAGSFYAPCVDGDYDMSVIAHEFTHMTENRMIGKGVRRTGHHAGAMGESVTDFSAMEYLNEYGFVPTRDENRYSVGAYATGNKLRGIRNYGMNFPMSGGVPEPGQQLNINALNFSDMGYDVTGPQVHADGEIWSATNFRIRTLLNEKYDDDFDSEDAELQESCADGQLPAQNCPGNRRWIQLYYDAMLLMPTAPSMLDARNAMLSADLMRFGGANQRELWLGFARSGYGDGATSSNTTADTDTDPTPSFTSPLENNATVTFRARARGGGTIANARFYVGHYEARVSPIADTNPTTSGSNLDDTAGFASGTYEFVAHAPGYGHVRFRERLRSGENERITVEFARNFASLAAGATASGDVWSGEAAPGGTPPSNVNFLIDDTESTNWTAAPPIAGGTFTADGTKVTVDLAGSDDVTVRYVQVSTHLLNDSTPQRAGQNRFTAIRQFEVWACNADEGDNCSTDGGYSRVYTSPANAFPGDPPRPVAPHLILRKFDTPNFEATHVRFVAKTTQCTGAPAFQGDQDADPGVDSDCDTNVVPGSATTFRSTRSFVRAAEFQVFDRDPDVD
jgi:extracellular elastinolytic metalloproteinase